MRATPPSSPGRLAGWGASAALLLTAILAVQSVTAAFRYADPVPRSDTIDVLWRYFKGPAWQFWLYHGNEHVMVAVMPAYWLDFHLFHARGLFLVAISLCFAALIGLLPARTAWRADRGPAAAAAGALFLASTLWFGNRWNFVFPLQLHMYTALLCIVAALCLVSPETPPGPRRAAAVSLLLSIGALSFGYGVIGFPAAGAIALLRRWPPRRLAVPVAAGALCAVITVAILAHDGMISFDHGRPMVRALPHSLSAAYMLAFLGSPVGNALRYMGAGAQAAIDVSWLAGALCLAVLAAQCALCLRRRQASVLSAMAMGLTLFCLLNALITNYARSTFGTIGALDERYIIGQLPLFFAVVLVALDHAPAHRSAPPAIAAGSAAAIAALLWCQQYCFATARSVNADVWQLAAAQISGVSDTAARVTEQVFEQDLLPYVNEHLRRVHWGAYAFPQMGWIGRNVASWGPAIPACGGYLDHEMPADDGALRAMGWAVAPDGGTGPQWLILADDAGVVRGVAHNGFPRGDAGIVARAGAHNAAGWVGYAPLPPGTHLTPYLMLKNKHPCALGH